MLLWRSPSNVSDYQSLSTDQVHMTDKMADIIYGETAMISAVLESLLRLVKLRHSSHLWTTYTHTVVLRLNSAPSARPQPVTYYCACSLCLRAGKNLDFLWKVFRFLDFNVRRPDTKLWPWNSRRISHTWYTHSPATSFIATCRL